MQKRCEKKVDGDKCDDQNLRGGGQQEFFFFFQSGTHYLAEFPLIYTKEKPY